MTFPQPLLVFHGHGSFDEYWLLNLWNVSIGVGLTFLMIRLRLCIFSENSTEVTLCASQCIVPGVHDVDLPYYSMPFIFNGTYG